MIKQQIEELKREIERLKESLSTEKKYIEHIISKQEEVYRIMDIITLFTAPRVAEKEAELKIKKFDKQGF